MIYGIQEATQAGTQAAALPWSSAILSAGVVAAVVGLVGVIIGQYLTGRRHSEDLRLREQGQITERFTRAIDQLGATDDKGRKKLEIRLGGIYALERIARDSERDHWPIMETLTTYVREHAPWPPKKDTNKDRFLPPPNTALRHQKAANKPDEPEPEPPTPDPDIQAILTVLRRRIRHYGNGELDRIDLHETDLRGAILDEAHLEGASLEEAHLESAHLQGAHLQGAHLRGAYLEGAHLVEAHLQGANLWRAHLQIANLREAHLEGAYLWEAKGLRQAQLEEAIGDENTGLPHGYERPKSWTQGEGEQTDENE